MAAADRHQGSLFQGIHGVSGHQLQENLQGQLAAESKYLHGAPFSRGKAAQHCFHTLRQLTGIDQRPGPGPKAPAEHQRLGRYVVPAQQRRQERVSPALLPQHLLCKGGQRTSGCGSEQLGRFRQIQRRQIDPFQETVSPQTHVVPMAAEQVSADEDQHHRSAPAEFRRHENTKVINLFGVVDDHDDSPAAGQPHQQRLQCPHHPNRVDEIVGRQVTEQPGQGPVGRLCRQGTAAEVDPVPVTVKIAGFPRERGFSDTCRTQDHCAGFLQRSQHGTAGCGAGIHGPRLCGSVGVTAA